MRTISYYALTTTVRIGTRQHMENNKQQKATRKQFKLQLDDTFFK
jgi:hypothetical protein